MTENRREIEKIDFENEFSYCPACGYKNGFHNMYRKTEDEGVLGWYLICPQCSKIYDIGLTAEI